MHRWSQLFIPTLREAPADAEVASHKFLVRAGYIRQLGAGIYSYLFLGQRSILKISNIVRDEMDKIGQEFNLPVLHPREIWEASGRWATMGETCSDSPRRSIGKRSWTSSCQVLERSKTVPRTRHKRGRVFPD